MRHSCLFVAVSLTLLTLTGCRIDSGGDSSSTLNPASNVDLTFSSFELTQQINNTLLADLVQAVEPDSNVANSEQFQPVAESIREQLAQFAGLGYTHDTPPGIRSVRNPLDLIRRVIGENEVANFQEGRQYIVRRIERREAGEYNNRTNRVQIRFTDQSAVLEGRPEQDYSWPYPIVKWVYTPESSNRVTRVLTWTAAGDFPAGSTRPSATLGTQFKPVDFASTGYNDGARISTEGTIVIVGEREMSFTRSYKGLDADTLIIDGTKVGTEDNTVGGPEFNFAGNRVDCVKIHMAYDAPEVRVFTSLNQAPGSADYCSEKTTPDYQYATRQTGLRP